MAYEKKLLTDEDLEKMIAARYDSIQNRSVIFNRQLFTKTVIDFINSVVRVYGNNDSSDKELQYDLIIKIFNNVENFVSNRFIDGINFDSSKNKTSFNEHLMKSFQDMRKDKGDKKRLGYYHTSLKAVVYDEKHISDFVAKIKFMNTKLNYEDVQKEIDENQQYFGFSEDAKSIFDYNIACTLYHELLHAIKEQYSLFKRYTEENKIVKTNGFDGLIWLSKMDISNKKAIMDSYVIFDEVINEYQTLSLLPDMEKYKRDIKIENYKNNSKNQYITKSYIGSETYGKNKDNDIYKSELDAIKLQESLYHQGIHIAELIEMIVGKKELFFGSMNKVDKIYENFNNKYEECFKKYENKIAMSPTYKNMCFENKFLNQFTPMDITAFLTHDFMKKHNVESLQLLQTVLIECIIKNVDDIKLNNLTEIKLLETEHLIREMRQCVKDLLVLPIKNLALLPEHRNYDNPTTVQKTFERLTIKCANKLHDIDDIKEAKEDTLNK